MARIPKAMVKRFKQQMQQFNRWLDGGEQRPDWMEPEPDPGRVDLEKRCAMLLRHKNEFFDIIERIEAQRDEWRDMLKDSVGKYHTALGMLERELRLERVRNAKLLVAFNKLREEKKLEPIKTPRYLDRELGVDADPVGLAAQYQEAVAELMRQGSPDGRKKRRLAGEPEDRPEDIDGKAEREAIVQRQGSDD